MIIRQQLCGGNAGARIPHGFARQGNPCAAQNAQRLGAGQNAGLVFICIVAQCGTIANKGVYQQPLSFSRIVDSNGSAYLNDADSTYGVCFGFYI